MNDNSAAQLSAEWKSICEQFSAQDLNYTFQFISEHCSVFVTDFYKQMMSEEYPSSFISADVVKTRLKNTLHKWLIDSFEVPLKGTYDEIVKQQFVAGEVHARIGVPSWLIMHGIRQIKVRVFHFLYESQPENALRVADYIVHILSFASEIMCQAYEEKLEVHNDIKHSYRLFSAMQDVAIQKDKQRGSLLDWENDLMFKVFSDYVHIDHPLVSKSEFGLWFIHKAAYAFASSDQVPVIVEAIATVDELALQIMSGKDKATSIVLIQQMRAKNREILLLVDQLFQVAEYVNAGNDSLTQLLNRRYLSTIVSREIHFARKNDAPLTLLALDADYFKKINDRWGHSAGDKALQVLADVIIEHTRGSDYAFRIGGEEFLLLLIDTDMKKAKIVAESIRTGIEKTTVCADIGVNFNFTISIGLTQYNGHPDYQRFLDAADTALYAAKHNGRNNVYVM